MNKRLSIKTRVAIWYAIGILIIIATALWTMSYAGSVMVTEKTKDSLKSAVDQVADDISLSDGTVFFGPDINYHRYGSSIAVYNSKGVNISGLLPDDFPEDVEFIDSEIRPVHGEHEYFVYDRLLQNPRTGDVWVRGIISADIRDMSSELFMVVRFALTIFPILFALAVLGGLLITGRAFLPLKEITDTAMTITEKGDLSRRIPHGDDSSNDEILRAAGVFNNMLDKVETTFQNEKRFTNDASHELRTPTAVIMMQSEYALENLDDKEEVEASLNTIHDESKKMQSLVSQLLTLARADNGKLTLNKERTDISLLAEEACERQRRFAAENGVEIKIDCDEGIYMDADPVFFSRIYDNLITNAVKYSKEKGKIYLSVKQEVPVAGQSQDGTDTEESQNGSDRQIKIIVRDDGIGIDEKALPHIFDRFYREDATYRADSLGLGLPIVKLIVEAHGGTIECSSVKNVGTRFTITFI
ncbi:MAG: HAMP domain-containing histidine kinase [Eubacterium sp.]|nr:HAMP domain-containing histidine kinase [Eubacterium sp.]